MIQVSQLSHSFGDTSVLKGISFEAKAGEMLAIVGPNGSGKSTLLRLIAGEVPLQAGDLNIAGKSLAEWTSQEQARFRAFLPQHSSLNFPFTVEEVVQMGRTPFAKVLDAGENQRACREALEAVGLTDAAERNYLELSGGEKRRVQWARVLAQLGGVGEATSLAQRYLLLDEPTESMDLAYKFAVMEHAREQAEAGVVVIIVLHDLEMAHRYADYCLLLDKGEQVAWGNTPDVLTPEQILSTFQVQASYVEHGDERILTFQPKR